MKICSPRSSSLASWLLAFALLNSLAGCGRAHRSHDAAVERDAADAGNSSQHDPRDAGSVGAESPDAAKPQMDGSSAASPDAAPERMDAAVRGVPATHARASDTPDDDAGPGAPD